MLGENEKMLFPVLNLQIPQIRCRPHPIKNNKAAGHRIGLKQTKTKTKPSQAPAARENLGAPRPAAITVWAPRAAAPSGRPGPRQAPRSPRPHGKPQRSTRVHTEPRARPPAFATYLEPGRHHRAASGRLAAGSESLTGSTTRDGCHTQSPARRTGRGPGTGARCLGRGRGRGRARPGKGSGNAPRQQRAGLE